MAKPVDQMTAVEEIVRGRRGPEGLDAVAENETETERGSVIGIETGIEIEIASEIVRGSEAPSESERKILAITVIDGQLPRERSPVRAAETSVSPRDDQAVISRVLLDP